MFYRKGKIWAPNDLPLKKLIFESEHDTVAASHTGMDKTVELISRNFYWPNMAEDSRGLCKALPAECAETARSTE